MDADAIALLSGPVFNQSNGHAYYLLTADTWSASSAFAHSLNGYLVTINDWAENVWVSDTFTVNGTINRALWIGLNDVRQEGTWVWASGESVTYLGWDIGQPNSANGRFEEDYAHFWAPGYGGSRYSWNDYLDGSFVDGVVPLHGVVEVSLTPVPAPAPILAFASTRWSARQIRALRRRLKL